MSTNPKHTFEPGHLFYGKKHVLFDGPVKVRVKASGDEALAIQGKVYCGGQSYKLDRRVSDGHGSKALWFNESALTFADKTGEFK